MIPVLLVLSPASAADCVPLDVPGLRARVEEARVAVDRDDLVSFAEVRRALFRDLPCLEEPLPTDAWARFLLDDAVVNHALGEGWQPALDTALTLDPTLPRGDLPEPLRDWSARPPRSDGGPLGPGEFWLDGVPIDAVPEFDGAHVVQRRNGDVFETRLLRDAPFPEDWRAPQAPDPVPVPAPSPVPEPAARRHGSVPLAVTGLVLAVAGAGVGVGSWAIRGSVHDPAAGDRLVLANVAGWSAAAVGGVVGGVGLVVPVQGRFR